MVAITPDEACRTTERFIRVALKNPKRDDVFEQIRIEASATVCDLKARIEAEYPDHPRRSLITLVYAGKVLRDDGAVLSDVFLGLSAQNNTVVVHMVVKQAEQLKQLEQLEQVTQAKPVEQRPAASSTTVEASETAMPTPPPPRVASVDTHGDGDVAENEDAAESRPPAVETHRRPVEAETPSSRPPTTAATTGSSESAVYDAVLKSSYQAALRTIMSDTASSHAGGFMFIPAMIPVPRAAIEGPRRLRAQDAPEGLRAHLRPIFGAMQRGNDNQNHDHHNHGRNGANVANENNNVVVDGPNLANVANVANDAVAANNNENRNNDRRHFQIRIHINLRMIFQFAVAGFILYQHCPPSRMLGLGLIGLLFYLSTTELGHRLLRRILQSGEAANPQRVERDGDGGGGGDARVERPAPAVDGHQPAEEQNQGRQDGAGHGSPPVAPPPAPAPPPPPARRGWLREVQAFVLGFLASLLPAADEAGRPENVPQDVFGGQQR